MSYQIDDYSKTKIFITDGWREWYLPKFRINMEVAEPLLTINWDDAELGSPARRQLVLDYTDVSGYGYANPTSAADLKSIIEAYEVSAWTDIGPGGNLLINKADLLSHDGIGDAILPGGTNEYLLSRDDTELTGLKWISKAAALGSITEVVTTSLNSTTNDYAISGADPSASVTTILRITPTVSFKLCGIDTTGWGNGKRLIIENVTDALTSASRMMIIERNSATSTAGNRFNYPALNMPIIIIPGGKMVFEYNTTSGFLEALDMPEPGAFFTLYSECYVTQPFGTNIGGAGSSLAFSASLTGDTTMKPQGVLFAATGTTATGRSFLSTSINSIMLGYGSMITLSRSGVAVLSTAIEEYSWISGLCDNNNVVAPTDAVAWQYDRTYSTDWTTITASNNTPTQNIITGFTPTTNQMVYLGTFVNGDASNAEFFYSIDGEVWEFTPTPHTATIPSGAARLTGVQVGVVKAAGLTSRGLSIDSCGYKTIMKRGI